MIPQIFFSKIVLLPKIYKYVILLYYLITDWNIVTLAIIVIFRKNV